MTITLSWWFWPLALVVFAVAFSVLSDRRGGMGSGCLGALVLLVCLALAVGIAVGRLLLAAAP